jgi:hypothetical protein
MELGTEPIGIEPMSTVAKTPRKPDLQHRAIADGDTPLEQGPKDIVEDED